MEKDDRSTECVCPACDSASEVNAVCGSDGRTYASMCHLEASICKTKKQIKIDRKGACSKLKFLS